jgi:hypothetical protein
MNKYKAMGWAMLQWVGQNIFFLMAIFSLLSIEWVMFGIFMVMGLYFKLDDILTEAKKFNNFQVVTIDDCVRKLDLEVKL